MMLTVSSLLFCQDIKRFYMSMTKLIINGLSCFFFPAVFMQTLYYFIAWLKIRNTISLAKVTTIMFVYTFFFWWITEL